MSVQIYSAVVFIILVSCILAQVTLTLNSGIPERQNYKGTRERKGLRTLERILNGNSPSAHSSQRSLIKFFKKSSDVSAHVDSSMSERESRKIHLVPGETSINHGMSDSCMLSSLNSFISPLFHIVFFILNFERAISL